MTKGLAATARGREPHTPSHHKENDMGMYHTTYFAYGARIPDADGEQLEEKLCAFNEQHGSDLGYLTVGDYDRDMTFLVTECTDVDLGKHKVVTPQADPSQYATWDAQIREFADLLGVDPMHAPGWIVVPDLS